MSEKYEAGTRAYITEKTTGLQHSAYMHERMWVSDETFSRYAQGEVNVRLLVVIDPENDAEVERFREIASRWADRVPYAGSREPGDLTHRDAMQAALREFANPPKPDEPTGLGAVVEVDSSAAGVGRKRLVRTHNTVAPWYGDGVAREWEDIPASFNIEVLSEGVQP